MSTVIAIKMSSGEEILGKVKAAPQTIAISAQEAFDGGTRDDFFNPASGFKVPDVVTLSQPRVLHIQQGPQGQMGLGLVPWALSNPEADVTINLKDAALAVFLPAPKLEEAYLQQTSNIQIASSLPQKPQLNG